MTFGLTRALVKHLEAEAKAKTSFLLLSFCSAQSLVLTDRDLFPIPSQRLLSCCTLDLPLILPSSRRQKPTVTQHPSFTPQNVISLRSSSEVTIFYRSISSPTGV